MNYFRGSPRKLTIYICFIKRGVPNVETIYLVLIKKRELLSEITRCVSDHENELTCLANK